jgi:hypothetical protein
VDVASLLVPQESDIVSAKYVTFGDLKDFRRLTFGSQSHTDGVNSSPFLHVSPSN